MEKIHGYLEKDVKGLIEFLQNRKKGSLSSLFSEYATLNGKSQGTIRNLYYAMAKRSREDGEFCRKYLDGKPLLVSKIKEFDSADELELVRKVVLGNIEGKSVRKSMTELANGDGTLALRYQNKFRNIAKTKPELIRKIEEEIGDRGLGEQNFLEISDRENRIVNLKREINGLVDRIGEGLRRENLRLKRRVAILENENLRLFKKLAEKNKLERQKDEGLFLS